MSAFPLATQELLAELDEAQAIADAHRVFEIRDTERTRVGIEELLIGNQSDEELCVWIRSAGLGSQIALAQGSIVLRRVE